MQQPLNLYRCSSLLSAFGDSDNLHEPELLETSHLNQPESVPDLHYVTLVVALPNIPPSWLLQDSIFSRFMN